MARPKRSLLEIIQLPSYLIIFLWIIHFLKIGGIVKSGVFGLMPRETSRILGIFTSPFIHGDFQHLISNSVPLFVMSLMILFFYKKIAYRSIFMIYVLTGLAVWAFARTNVIHIGASGVVYGLVSFVFWTGLFRRNLQAIVLALIMVLLYSGLFLGVFPTKEGISWESHLFGGIVGIIIAYVMRNSREDDEEDADPWKDEKASDEYFLPPDTFEETLLERAKRRQAEQRGGDWTSDIA